MAVPDDLRARLTKLCMSKRHRVTKFSSKRPVRWHPTSVCDLGSTTPFTESGAWEFIACHIEDGTQIKTITLDKPPDKIGYVMLVGGNCNEKIYIKLEIVGEKVFGRSFHASGEQEWQT